jgi:hypothetical protein
MRMLGRFVLNGLTVLSLVLCVAAAVLWVRSYWRVDSLMLFRADRQWTSTWKDGSIGTFRAGRVYEADSRCGSLRLLYLYENLIYYRRLNPAVWFSADEDALEPWAAAAAHWPGVAIESRPVRRDFPNGPGVVPGDPPPPPIAYTVHALYAPWAFWTFLTALLPAWALGHRLRRLRCQSAGRCPHCAYDLTGNVSGVCPECGRAVARRTGDVPQSPG